MTREVLAQPNVRLAIIDDQAIDENDRGRWLGQFRKLFSGVSLLYVAGNWSDGNEKRARANGAQYYVSKPLSPERFGQVLQSFLKALHVDGRSNYSTEARSRQRAERPSLENPARVDAGIPSLSNELNREDSLLRFRLLEAALAGLRLERNPESLPLRLDTAQLWAVIEPILSHHLATKEKGRRPGLSGNLVSHRRRAARFAPTTAACESW